MTPNIQKNNRSLYKHAINIEPNQINNNFEPVDGMTQSLLHIKLIGYTV